MLGSVRKPKARTWGSAGITIHAKGTNPFDDDADDICENRFTRTDGYQSGSAFDPVPASPPKIERKVHAEDANKLNSICNDASQSQKSFATPSRPVRSDEKKPAGSPCDTTQDTSLWSSDPFVGETNQTTKKGKGTWGKSSAFKSQMKHIKKNLPKKLKQMSRNAPPKQVIDLSDLAVAAICIVPRHGAGIAVGRMPFERMRTSLMLHMEQENKNVMWKNEIAESLEGESGKKGKAQVAKLNTVLRNCIADEQTTFVEKSQDAVRLSRDALEVSAYLTIIFDVMLRYDPIISLNALSL